MKGLAERFWVPFSITVIFILIVVLASVLITTSSHQRGLVGEENAEAAVSPAGFTKPSSSEQLVANGNVYWIADLVERALPFVVHVRTERIEKHPSFFFKDFRDKNEGGRNPFEDFFPFDFDFNAPEIQEKEIPVPGVGSGFIVSEDGYIVTNTHVVQGAKKITVVTNDGKEFPAKVVGTDKLKDIAVLKIEGKNLPSARLGDSSKVRIGEPAIAIGSPFGLEATVTAGIVSSVGRDAQVLRTPTDAEALLGSRIKRFIQTDAAIHQGNSGGPLLNAKGEVIGVNQSIIAGGTRIGFAIPVNELKASIEQLIKKGKVVYPGIGVMIQEVNEATKDDLKVEVDYGAYVWQVNAGGAADKAGVEPGDVILQIEKVKVAKADDLIDEIQRHRVGEKVTLLVAKSGKKNKQIKLAVILQELDAEE